MSGNESAAPTVDRLLSLRDVRELLLCSENSVRRLVASGRLPAVRFSEHGQLRFRARDVRAFIDGAVRR